jgi:hypothetical protein
MIELERKDLENKQDQILAGKICQFPVVVVEVVVIMEILITNLGIHMD